MRTTEPPSRSSGPSDTTSQRSTTRGRNDILACDDRPRTGALRQEADFLSGLLESAQRLVEVSALQSRVHHRPNPGLFARHHRKHDGKREDPKVEQSVAELLG